MKRPILRTPDHARLSTVLLAVLLPLAYCLLACGCGGGESYDLAPVSGQVTLDGNPMAGVSVSFQPAPGNSGPGSSGVTDSSGNFSLETIGESSQKGAVPGKHIVTLAIVSGGEEDDAGGGAAAESPLPPQCGDGSLTFDVPAGGTDQANFPLESQ